MKKIVAGIFRKQAPWLLLNTVLLIGVVIITHFPEIIEQVYAQRLYPVIARITQFMFNRIPFSVGDAAYIMVSGAVLYLVIKELFYLFKKRYAAALTRFLRMIIGVQLMILVFYGSWGLNYFRVPASRRFHLSELCCTVGEIKQVTGQLIDSANYYRYALRKKDVNMEDKTLFSIAETTMNALSAKSSQFTTYSPRIKPSLLSGLMNYLSTSGYYNPFTAESQLNDQIPLYIKPFTACHELSHQIGYSFEDEASFGGFIACASAPDRLFRYSAYYTGLHEFMFELRMRDSTAYKEMRSRISPLVLTDLKNERKYWRKFRGKAGMISSLMYDDYLKFNNQPKGLLTYNEMVRLVTCWYRRNRSFAL